jgi:hypothetical protein
MGSEQKTGEGAGLILFFVKITGASRDDWTGQGSQLIWADIDPEQAATLRDQLTVLLGEPHREVLLDDSAMKFCVDGTGDGPGVIMDRG